MAPNVLVCLPTRGGSVNIAQMLFSAQGRVRRRDYWWWLIGVGVVFMAIDFAAHQLLTRRPASAFFDDDDGWLDLVLTPFNLFQMITTLLVMWPEVCISAKRWHDRNRSGWLAVLYTPTFYCLWFLQRASAPGDGTEGNWPMFIVVSTLTIVLLIWQFVELGCLDGTKGPNRYGPSPKGIGTPEQVF